MTIKSNDNRREARVTAHIRGSNQSALRAHNELMILTLLRSAGPMPKADVARMIGLSPQTASVIMRNLENEGLIERCEPLRGKVGQPSVPMQLAKDGALFFGAKIGRRRADIVLVDFLGSVISQEHTTYQYPTPNDIIEFVIKTVDGLTGKMSNKHTQRIAGLGIAIPSYLWEWTDIIGVPAERMANWRERDIYREIEGRFDFPVFSRNDASCACGAELYFGTQALPGDFLYVFVGYFVGGGIVLNSNPVPGPTGNAAALGPLPVPFEGNMKRQLVEVASLSSLEKLIRESGGDSSTIWESSSIWQMDQMLLRKWLTQTSRGLAHAIVACCSVIDFQVVVVDGWMPKEVRSELIGLIDLEISKFNLAGLIRPDLRVGSIGPDARSLGAATLPLSSRFLI